jgi:hypothetical protein
MKSRVSRILSIGIAMAAVAAVHAQDRTVTASVPFSFYVGSNLMPQGAYRIGETSTGIAWLTSVSRGDGKGIATFTVAGKKQDEPARLVFHCYAENCFLAEIWSGDSGLGRGLSRTQREKELAHGSATPSLAVVRLGLPK